MSISSKQSLNCSIIHSLPGRVRISLKEIKSLKSIKNEIEDSIKNLGFIKEIYINDITENALILYNFNKINEDEIKQIFEDFIIENYSMQIQNERKEIVKDICICTESKEENTLSILKKIGIASATLLYTYNKNKSSSKMVSASGIKKLFTIPSIVSLGLTAPAFKSGFEAIYKNRKPNDDTLTATSIMASLILGKDISALMIILISNTAELLTTYTMERTRKSIKDMLNLNEEYAWRQLEDGSVEKVKVEDINKDDIVVVHAGEKICVDGAVISGEGVVDQSQITGEYMPAIKKKGTKVFAGSIVKNGTLNISTEKAGDKTVVSRILHLVEDAESKRAPIQNYADEFATYLIPFSFLSSAVTYIITKSATRALNMLVIDFACGIKLSTATAFSAAINRAIKNGVLIKGGNYIEEMAHADTLIFDKTGTLTEGRPQVTSTTSTCEKFSEKEIIEIAAAAEETSNHPLAIGIISKIKSEGWNIPTHGEIINHIARGSETNIGDDVVRVGSKVFMEENNIDTLHIKEKEQSLIKDGEKLVYVALNENLIGIIGIQDKLRDNMKKSINNLRYRGIHDIILLTGDLKEHAEATATKMGVDSFKWELLPSDKADIVKDIQSKGSKVIMVGDGVNDAPALAYADVGVSMGGGSTDIAIEASDITIQSEDPMMLPEVIKLSKETMKVVKQNFGLVFTINGLGILLSAVGVLPVFWGAVLHNSSTVLVVTNSVRLLYFDKKRAKK